VQDQKTPNDWQHPASMSENEGPFRSICVFCDALDGLNPLYAKAASELGEALVKRNISLVYGGACMLSCYIDQIYASFSHLPVLDYSQ
jgi:hypothetical protein